MIELTLGHDEGWDSGGGDGRNHGVPLLLDRDLAVPPAVHLGGGEHVAAAAHVAKGTLAGTVGSTATDTGDTGHGTASAPRLGASLVTWFKIRSLFTICLTGAAVSSQGFLRDSFSALSTKALITS